MDIIGSLVAMIIFSPLFLLIAAIIKIVSPGPVFFQPGAHWIWREKVYIF